MSIIRAAGSQRAVEVSARGAMHTDSVVRENIDLLTEFGRAFEITTTLTMTSANENGLLYVKNNENQDVILEGGLLSLGNTTGGSATSNWTFKGYRNPSTGTLISDANAATIVNRNFGSFTTLTGDVYDAAAVEESITDGTVGFQVTLPSAGVYGLSFDNARLPKGATVAFSIQAPASNTSAVATFNLRLAVDDGTARLINVSGRRAAD